MQETLSMADFYPQTTLKQAPTAPTPPTRIDILLDIYTERERLKTLREQIACGAVKATRELNAEMYITQLILSANKTALEALKENNITLTQNNITQIKHVVKFVKPTTKLPDTDS